MLDYEYAVAKSSEFNEMNDCAVKAISIATNIVYESVHKACALLGRKPRSGTKIKTMWQIIDNVGYKRVGKRVSMTVNQLGKQLDDYPGTYLVHTKGHVFCVKDKKIHDWTVGRRFKVIYIEELTKK